MDKPWNPRLTRWLPDVKIAVNFRGTLKKNTKKVRPKLWECIFEVEKVKEKLSIGGVVHIKQENKPSSLRNRLCQNSCKINRIWKSRVDTFTVRVRHNRNTL